MHAHHPIVAISWTGKLRAMNSGYIRNWLKKKKTVVIMPCRGSTLSIVVSLFVSKYHLRRY